MSSSEISGLVQAPRHVVVATDFSPTADQALSRAIALSNRLAAKITLLHVVEPMPVVSAWGDPGGASWLGIEVLLDAGKAALARQVARIPDAAGRDVALQCQVGMPRSDLGSIAQDLDGDLLILGARNTRTLGDRLLGSTAQATVHRCPIPLLVVRRASAAPWTRCLASTDFSAASLHAAALGALLAPNAEHRLMYVHPPLPEATLALMQPDPAQLEAYTQANETQAAARLDAEGARLGHWGVVFRRGQPVDEVVKEADDRAIDLLCLGTRGHGPWLGGLLGSVGQAVLAHTSGDVLLAPA
jgi:nucleotide-binding universal stress UspA family protein